MGWHVFIFTVVTVQALLKNTKKLLTHSLCCPAFNPHIVGTVTTPGALNKVRTWKLMTDILLQLCVCQYTVIVNVSWQAPPSVSRESAGPIVVKVSKSNRRKQMSGRNVVTYSLGFAICASARLAPMPYRASADIFLQ